MPEGQQGHQEGRKLEEELQPGAHQSKGGEGDHQPRNVGGSSPSEAEPSGQADRCEGTHRRQQRHRQPHSGPPGVAPPQRAPRMADQGHRIERQERGLFDAGGHADHDGGEQEPLLGDEPIP